MQQKPAPALPPMPFQKTFSRRWPLASGGEVRVKVDNGAVIVEGWDRPEVAIELLIRADAAAKLDQVTPETTADAEHVRLMVQERYPPTRYDWRRDGPGANFWPALTTVTLRLPRTAALNLQSNNGNLEIRGLLGAVDATTFNGRLRYALERGADQQILVKTYNGALYLPEPLFRRRDKQALATLGRGTERVVLNSFNGVVDVR